MFEYAFMQNAFIVAILISIVCPLIGIFLVLRRYSMIGDALSHAPPSAGRSPVGCPRLESRPRCLWSDQLFRSSSSKCCAAVFGAMPS